MRSTRTSWLSRLCATVTVAVGATLSLTPAPAAATPAAGATTCVVDTHWQIRSVAPVAAGSRLVVNAQLYDSYGGTVGFGPTTVSTVAADGTSTQIASGQTDNLGGFEVRLIVERTTTLRYDFAGGPSGTWFNGSSCPGNPSTGTLVIEVDPALPPVTTTDPTDPSTTTDPTDPTPGLTKATVKVTSAAVRHGEVKVVARVTGTTNIVKLQRRKAGHWVTLTRARPTDGRVRLTTPARHTKRWYRVLVTGGPATGKFHLR